MSPVPEGKAVPLTVTVSCRTKVRKAPAPVPETVAELKAGVERLKPVCVRPSSVWTQEPVVRAGWMAVLKANMFPFWES